MFTNLLRTLSHVLHRYSVTIPFQEKKDDFAVMRLRANQSIISWGPHRLWGNFDVVAICIHVHDLVVRDYESAVSGGRLGAIKAYHRRLPGSYRTFHCHSMPSLGEGACGVSMWQGALFFVRYCSKGQCLWAFTKM